MKRKTAAKPKRSKRLGKKTAHPLREELAMVAKGVKGMVYMEEVPDILAVPTILPGFDRAVQVGGMPLGSPTIVHGPPHGGKSLFAIVAGVISFQRMGHLAYFIDAEHSGDVQRWFQRLGVDLSEAMYDHPRSYDEVLHQTVTLADNFVKLFKSGELPPHRAMSIVIDSVTKCVPKSELDKMRRDGTVERNAGRWRAAFTKYFLDNIMPVIGHYPIALICIAHEGKGEPMWPGGPPTYRVKGGEDLLFSARNQFRVTFAGFEKQGKALVDPDTPGAKAKGVKIAKRHKVRIVKNKVGFPDSEFYFYSGTREGIEQGRPWLDLGRSLFQESLGMGIVRRDGSYYEHTDREGEVRRMMKERWVSLLNTDADLHADLLEEARMAGMLKEKEDDADGA